MESGPALPVKRIATEMDKSTSATGKENPSIPRPVKKAKIRATADNGLLRGRPILQDLVNAAS
jgi:DNA replication ATP-dependent helicase Dna2